MESTIFSYSHQVELAKRRYFRDLLAYAIHVFRLDLFRFEDDYKNQCVFNALLDGTRFGAFVVEGKYTYTKLKLTYTCNV